MFQFTIPYKHILYNFQVLQLHPHLERGDINFEREKISYSTSLNKSLHKKSDSNKSRLIFGRILLKNPVDVAINLFSKKKIVFRRPRLPLSTLPRMTVQLSISPQHRGCATGKFLFPSYKSVFRLLKQRAIFDRNTPLSRGWVHIGAFRLAPLMYFIII